jgi:hypothetical protein
VGADRLDRRHPEAAEWKLFERAALGHYPATPLESTHIVPRMLVTSWYRTGVTVQFASEYPVTVEQPHELLTRLDAALVQLGVVPKLEKPN